MVDICKSGGAKGADTAFGEHAKAAGHEVVHFAFSGMGMLSENKPYRHVMHHLDLYRADPLLKEVSSWKGIPFPCHTDYTNNLLRRNMFQMEETVMAPKTERVYAVSYIGDNGVVAGGTGWAVTMGILMGIHEVYVFDQALEKWFKFEHALESPTQKLMRWNPIDIPPKPFGIYAGIGSVEIKECGLNAIDGIYK